MVLVSSPRPHDKWAEMRLEMNLQSIASSLRSLEFYLRILENRWNDAARQLGLQRTELEHQEQQQLERINSDCQSVEFELRILETRRNEAREELDRFRDEHGSYHHYDHQQEPEHENGKNGEHEREHEHEQGTLADTIHCPRNGADLISSSGADEQLTGFRPPAISSTVVLATIVL